MKPKLKDIDIEIGALDVLEAVERLCSYQSKFGLNVDKLLLKYRKKKEAYLKEVERFRVLMHFENQAYLEGLEFIAGIDEVGRGPLAGPVVAAAVILPKNIFIEGLDDSKKLSATKRDQLYQIIKEKAISYGIGIVDHKIIDEINILNATKLAMKKAVEALNRVPQLLLIDAVKLSDIPIRQNSMEKGDSLSASIAAASVIAKVTRDRMIEELDTEYPQYGFAKHKGYGTKDHICAIQEKGPCPIHRKTFIKNFI